MSIMRPAIIAGLSCCLIGGFSGCRRDDPPPPDILLPPYDGPSSLTLVSDQVTVDFELDHFRMRVLRTTDGSTILETPRDELPDGKDKVHAYGPIGFTHRDTQLKSSFIEGYDHAIPSDEAWRHAWRPLHVTAGAAMAVIDLADPKEPQVTLRLDVHVTGPDVLLDASLIDTRDDRSRPMNLMGQSFVLRDDERFVGLGEREGSVEHRGRHYQCWTEEGGLGGGENASPGPNNPEPNGPGMTHLPVPLLISSRGYGMWLETTFRTGFALGSDDPSQFRVYAEDGHLRYHLFADATPAEVLTRYTALTGRPRLPAPWVFGPRRRVDSDSMVGKEREFLALRSHRVPTTMADDTTHFLPNGSHLGRETLLAAWTADLHRKGFKAIGYFNPYVSATKPEAASILAEGRSLDAFVRLDDGSEFLAFMMSGGGQKVVTIDLTKPSAVAWYQRLLQQALDLGYDGWMLDFGEYLPQRAKMANGMTGYEAHNLFPLLSQRANFDYLTKVRGDDFMFFARAGYAGTQAVTPVVWSGDPSASFDPARGLPAQVRAGITAGLSGIAFWGSDISGYTCLQDPPADKDVYLRWAAFGALSSDMHDENACAGAPDGAKKWTLWNDAETTQVYGDYARLHTRLFPYIYAAAHDATQSGMPVLRHPVLMRPDVPAAWGVTEEYFFGPSLYVAPVIARNAATRELWLPPGTWFDWWTLERLVGDARVTRQAPYGRLPLFLKAGGIVPLLDPAVETLFPTDDPGVVDMNDRKDVLDVRAAVSKADPDASIGLVDGTTLDVVLTGEDIALQDDVPQAADDNDLANCARCGSVSTMPDGTRHVRITASSNTSLGGLAIGVNSTTKRIRWDILIAP